MKPQASRADIMPVILGGDMSAYPMAREFHEAYGVRSTCVIPDPIRIIRTSSFIDTCAIAEQSDELIVDAVCRLARENPGKRLLVMANQDASVARLERIRDAFPANVISPLPPHDAMVRASNKIEFARMCASYGLDAPRSEVVHLAGADPIPPTSIDFPLIAKPAESSAEYVALYWKGFKKIYFIQSQIELDQLWRDLRAEGFSRDFLVQELIGGDDTYVDMLTAYVDQNGKPTMFASAQVLLEDHDPKLFGNPVAMITRPMPELWEKVGRMLVDLGWRGFANFDMKRDPKTGRVLFMDFNPRLGCNSYYACAGGINPMRALVNDHVDGIGEVQRLSRKALYSRAPASLVRRYVADDALLAEFDQIVRDGLVFDPMRYRADSLGSRLMGWAMEKNYIRKFARHYPERTDTAF